MHRLIIILIAATLAPISLAVADTQQGGTASQEKKIRLGVYDNRAVAIAYAPSKFNPVRKKMEEYKKAKAAGDSERMKELEQWGEKHQRQLHRQGFARVPVDDLLAHVSDELPEVARRAKVDAIVWRSDYSMPGVEVVDVTDELVKLFDPSEKTLKTVEEIKKHKPVDLDELEHHKH